MLGGPLRGLRRRIGISDYEHDRHVLEEIVFPALLARADVRRVLFVGCDFYTAHYSRLLPGTDFTTIDPDPRKAPHGSDRHIVDSLVNLPDHFAPETLDAILWSGVIGWGLDAPDEIDAAASRCFEALRAGGLLVVGWNDVDERRPPPLQSLRGFQRFEPVTLPPFPAPLYPTFGRHRMVYEFYARPS